MKDSGPPFGIEDIVVELPAPTAASKMGFVKPAEYYREITGPEFLRVASPEDDAYSLCVRAVDRLHGQHPTLSAELDAIVVVTLPTKPTVAPISSRLQGHLRAPSRTFCLDITGSCVGFLQAASLIMDMRAPRGWNSVLLLNVETLTSVIRPEDQALRLIMSDGATATLFSERPRFSFERFSFFSDGENEACLTVRDKQMYMDGPKLYETVLRKVPDSFRGCLDTYGLQKNTVDQFIFHQASKRVLTKLMATLDLEESKVPLTIARVGNLGSCSIPHILSEELSKPRRPNRKIFATAFGAGFQWAHALINEGA